jgi:hypothetical protein
MLKENGAVVHKLNGAIILMKNNRTVLRLQVLTAASMKVTVFWDIAPYSLMIALMMEAVSTSETSVNLYQTARRNIPEDSHLQ